MAKQALGLGVLCKLDKISIYIIVVARKFYGELSLELSFICSHEHFTSTLICLYLTEEFIRIIITRID